MSGAFDPLGEGEPRRALTAMVSGGDAHFDLLPAALLVAREEYPDLDTAACIGQVERYAEAVAEAIGGAQDPGHQLAALNKVLFGLEGFHGNDTDYYDPRNSYVSDVLRRRTGIPLTLSLIYVEVGRRAGLPLAGVGLPAHYIVAYELPGPDRIFVDPFHCGRRLSMADCELLMQRAYGNAFRLQPSHLASAGARETLTRLITNLKGAYLRRDDWRRAVRASELLSVVHPSTQEIRERAVLRTRAGDLRGAARDLGSYLELAPDAPDAAEVQEQLRFVTELEGRRN